MTTNTDWIEWAGGECPVPGDTVVDIKTNRDTYLQQRAGGWHVNTWRHELGYFYGNDADIIAYRIVKP